MDGFVGDLSGLGEFGGSLFGGFFDWIWILDDFVMV